MEGGGHALGVKLISKYDPAIEAEVREWIKELTGVDIPAGPENMYINLRNGTILVELVQAVYNGTPELPPAAAEYAQFIKPNNSKIPFKQMENIEIFLKACQAYGVPSTGIFPTNNLFENKNMGNVLDCIQLLGTEAQRNNFNGPVCGPKPSSMNKRNFSYEKLKAGQGIISYQAGSNQFASQKGMSIGSVRHVSDIRADDISQSAHGVINLQSGTNKFASQKGMSMGAVRHVSDIRADSVNPESHGIINLQAGTNKFASQKGMAMGAVRHVSDIRADDMSRDSQAVINLQAGTNRFASQRGMSMGSVRHVGDIHSAIMNPSSHRVINLQAGTNRYASQKGMNIGSARHITDVQSDMQALESETVIRLQAGTNRCATANGLNFGKQRGINDIRVTGKNVNMGHKDQMRRYYDYDMDAYYFNIQQLDEDEGWL